MRYVALIHGDNKPGFGVSFPDFPGCVSDGCTVYEAIRRGREALTFHIENMAEDGEGIPRPRTRRKIEEDPHMAEWLKGARIVDIDIDNQPPAVVEAVDPFVRSIGEIFGRRLARFVESSIVPDLPGEGWSGVRAILLLESPYENEVQEGHPLVGKSGVFATKGIGENIPVMYGISGPLGNLVEEGDSRVWRLGIMNASRLPLEANAYQENDNDHRANIPAWCEFEKCLRYIKPRSGKLKLDRPVTERNEAALLMERAIVQDLQERLNGIPVENNLLLVCCGRIAQRIFERTRVPDGVRTAYAPHPSHGGWGKSAGRMRGVYDGIAHAIR